MLITSFFLKKITIILLALFLYICKTLFMQYLPLHSSYSFFVSLNDLILGIEKADRTYSVSFVTEDFSGLFLHPSISFIKDLNGVLSDFWF